MNEYWLLLFLVSIGGVLAWHFFEYLAKLAIWSSRPELDALRYGVITACLVIEIGDSFEVWEAALLGAVSLFAFVVVRRDRSLFESSMRELSERAKGLARGRGSDW